MRPFGGLSNFAMRGISINALSSIAGITQSTVSDIVNRTTCNTGVVTLKKLRGGLNIAMRKSLDSELFDDLGQDVRWRAAQPFSQRNERKKECPAGRSPAALSPQRERGTWLYAAKNFGSSYLFSFISTSVYLSNSVKPLINPETYPSLMTIAIGVSEKKSITCSSSTAPSLVTVSCVG